MAACHTPSGHTPAGHTPSGQAPASRPVPKGLQPATTATAAGKSAATGSAFATATPPAPSQAATAAPAGPRLTADSPYVDLPLSRGTPALVSLPLGAVTPQPLMVVTHGAGGTAQAHCKLWRRIAGPKGILLCVRGAAIYPHLVPSGEQRYFYPGHPSLAAEIARAAKALRQRYGRWVDFERPVFAGYSQGASMGAMVLPEHPLKFARSALVEGGFGQFQEWNIRSARRYRQHGGQRVLLACGRLRCMSLARKSASYMKRGGLEVKLVHAQGAGHTYRGKMESLLRQTFGWLIAGDERWQSTKP